MKARIIPKKPMLEVEFGGENPMTCNPKKLQRETHAIIVETNEEPNLYNSHRVFIGQDGICRKISYKTQKSNCVAFAMHIDYEASNTGWYIPGWLSTHRIPKDFKEMCSYMEEDLKVLGRKVHQIIWEEEMPEKLPVAPKGQYWIKCLTKGGIQGMHWMCKDEESGLWFHKVGWEDAPKIVERVTKTKRSPCAIFPLVLDQNDMDFLGIGEETEIVFEKEDKAGYVSYGLNEVRYYEPVFVMLIDE